MDTKKPFKPSQATAGKPETANNTTTRPSLPALTPAHDKKPATGDLQTEALTVGASASEKPAQPDSDAQQPTTAPAAGSKPAEVTSEKAATDSKTTDSAPTEKPTEKLGPKIRKRDEILAALRAGAKVEKIEGLYRIVNPDGSKNSTSKRRVLSLQSQKLLIASADGRTLTLDTEADKKASEPKAAAVPTTPKPEDPANAQAK